MDSEVARPLIFATVIPYCLAHIILGLANLSILTAVGPALLAMAICIVAMFIVVPRGISVKLSRRQSWAVIVATVTMDLVVNSGLPAHVHPGYAAWHTAAIQMILLGLALRGRLGMAWLGITLFALADLASSIVRGLEFVDAVVLVITPVMWIVIATAVIAVSNGSRREVALSIEQREQNERSIAKQHALQVLRTEWIQALDQLTRPALELVARGNLDTRDRTELMLVEAELRDGIRGRALATPAVALAARQARNRGVKVDILDDSDTQLPLDLLQESAGQLTTVLNHAQCGFVKARVWPLHSADAVTILAFDDRFPEDALHIQIRRP